jgi:hypothetical protein
MRAWILLFFAAPALASSIKTVDYRTLTAECTAIAQDGSEQRFRYSHESEYDSAGLKLPNVSSTLFGDGSLYYAVGTIENEELQLVFKSRLTDESHIRVVISHKYSDKAGWAEKRVVDDSIVKSRQFATLKSCRAVAQAVDDMGEWGYFTRQ